jgi:hypothetical protein
MNHESTLTRHFMRRALGGLGIVAFTWSGIGCSAADDVETARDDRAVVGDESVASVEQGVATPSSHMLCACAPADGDSFSGNLPCGTYDCDSGAAMVSACAAVCGSATVYQTKCIPSSTSWCGAPARPNRDYVSCNCNDGFRYGTCVNNTAEVQSCRTQTENHAKCSEVCASHGGFRAGNFTCTDNPAHCKFPRPDQVVCDCGNGQSLTVCADYPGVSFDQFVAPNVAELTKVCTPICAGLGGLVSARAGQSNAPGCAVQ